MTYLKTLCYQVVELGSKLSVSSQQAGSFGGRGSLVGLVLLTDLFQVSGTVPGTE